LATDTWKQTYRARAGIEGTIAQTIAVTAIRHARYTEQPQLELEHAFAATAINLIRLDVAGAPFAPYGPLGIRARPG
jgi:hypothetical protein